MINVSFKKPPSFGDTNSKLVKVKTKEDLLWKTLPFEEFLEMRVGGFFDPKFRCMIELSVEGRVVRLVTHQEEFDLAKEKYPQDLVIHISQILNMFRTAKDYKSEIPRVLIPVGVLDAEIQ